jgi:hypothetical protein
MCCATESGAAPASATPPWMARPKRVIRVKLFRRWFIIWNRFKFGLILSKLPLLDNLHRHSQISTSPRLVVKWSCPKVAGRARLRDMRRQA